jgi:hypothetical protein
MQKSWRSWGLPAAAPVDSAESADGASCRREGGRELCLEVPRSRAPSGARDPRRHRVVPSPASFDLHGRWYYYRRNSDAVRSEAKARVAGMKTSTLWWASTWSGHVAVLQLCANRHCLVFQIFRSATPTTCPSRWPASSLTAGSPSSGSASVSARTSCAPGMGWRLATLLTCTTSRRCCRRIGMCPR